MDNLTHCILNCKCFAVKYTFKSFFVYSGNRQYLQTNKNMLILSYRKE